MSEKTLLEYSKELEKYLKKKHIKSFEYSQCSNLKRIGRGGYAIVYEATFQGQRYAIKSLNNNLSFADKKIYQQFRHELKLLYAVEGHPNIVKFHGISRDTKSNNFMLVLQYANSGNLREYLQNKQEEGIYKILWTELVKIAKEITIGLKYLHEKDIIHRDLHSKNILINDGKALITDFGISQRLNDTTSFSSSGLKGMPAYIEPQSFIQYLKKIKPNKQSDIYSLGVLLWELTSGIPPFNGIEDKAIPFQILKDVREEPITNTPPDYVKLYKQCWSSVPTQRPTLDEILDQLKKLLKESPVEFIINNIIDKQITESTSKTSSYTTDSILSDDHTLQKVCIEGSQRISLGIIKDHYEDLNETSCNDIRVPFISDDNETNRQDFDHHHDKANKKLLELSDNTTSAHNASQLAAFHADADRIIKDCYEGTAVVKSRHEDLDRSDYYALEIELLANVLRNAIDGYKESENKLSTYYQKVKVDLKQEANKLIKQNPETNKVRILNIFSKVTGALVKFSDAIALEHHKLELVRKIYAHAKFAHDIKNWMSSCKLAMLNIQVGIIDQEVEIVSLEEEVASFQITVDQFKNMSYQVILPETDSRDIDEPQPEDKIKEFVQKRINRVLDEWYGLKDQLIKLRSNLDASKESQGLSHTIKDILANIEARVLNIESFITGEGIQRLPTKDDVIDRVRELDEIQERVDHLLTLKIEALDSMIIDLTDVQQRAGIAKALKNLQSLIDDKRVQLREAVKLVKFVKKADEMNTLMSSLLEITNTTTPDCPLQLLNVIDLQSRFTELNTKYDYIVRKLEGVKRAAEPLKDDWRVVNRLSILIEQWNELNKIGFTKKDELSCLLSGQKPLTKTQPGRSNSRMSVSRSNSLMSASRSDSRMSGSRSMSQPLYLAIPILVRPGLGAVQISIIFLMI
ncbi:kinase-like protein [Gigaspora margarita]|uniref:Kinase-like protein n=1 Tax=Gigaspora margarita TaxID=4874 RepID=A0A8H3XK58_GIGMA|nr:kinase-like protein [Gigaspora margarita]